MGLFLAACLVLLNVMIAGICPELSATYSTAPAATGQFKIRLMTKRWKKIEAIGQSMLAVWILLSVIGSLGCHQASEQKMASGQKWK